MLKQLSLWIIEERKPAPAIALVNVADKDQVFAIFKGLGGDLEAVTDDHAETVAAYMASCGAVVSFGQTFFEIYHKAIATSDKYEEHEDVAEGTQ